MEDKCNIIEMIRNHKIVVVCRNIYGDDLLWLANTLADGGIGLIEVTFVQSSPNCLQETADAIKMLRREVGQRMSVGAGTVMTEKQVEAAYEAGAQFIISPNSSEKVIKRTNQLGMVSMPGAMTPSEIISAYEWGADFVKLFPAATLGEKYAKDIMAPISHVPLVAVGGITEENAANYIELGMLGVAVGGRLADKECIKNRDYEELKKKKRDLLQNRV